MDYGSKGNSKCNPYALHFKQSCLMNWSTWSLHPPFGKKFLSLPWRRVYRFYVDMMECSNSVISFSVCINETRRFSNHESRLRSRAHTFAIIVIFFENTWKYVDTLILFSKNLNQRSLTPTWPLTPCLLRSHVWLYPRIIVSKSHDNTSMYVDTVINFANYHIHTHTTYILHTYYVHTTYRMSDHIVSYWTQFRRDKKETKSNTGAEQTKNQIIACK